MSILGLVTRGYLGEDGGFQLVELPPELSATELKPGGSTADKEPPTFSVKSVDSIPDPVVAEDLVPGFSVDYPSDQVPDAKPQEETDEPSVKIRPAEDLAPEIVKKDN